MRVEVGGTPTQVPAAYESRSPVAYAHRIAASGVPLQIWWSRRDRIVVDQRQESGALYAAIKRLNPDAPAVEFVGTWKHTAEMRASTRLPVALRLFGLLP